MKEDLPIKPRFVKRRVKRNAKQKLNLNPVEPSSNNMSKRVSPQQGGCWFCYTQDNNMVFDTEWDTYVHVDCIKKALAKDPDHPEAECMKYLLPEAAFNNIRARRIAAKYSHRDRVRRAQEAARIARHAKRFAPEAVHARVSARVVRALIKSAKIAMRHTGRRYTASGIAELREKAAAEAKKLCGPLPTVKIGTIRAVKRRRTFA